MKLSDLPSLPTTLDAGQTADIYGVSKWQLYELVKAGSCPVAPIRLGRRMVWPTAAVLRSIGVQDGP
jgi:hypothetical protein